MIEKTLIKQNEKNRINHTVAKQLNKNKETSSCNSCGVCNRLRSPHSSSEGALLALSQAKAIGKESCAASFMQRNYGNGFTAKLLSRPSAVGGQPTIQKKCSCGGSCSNCKGEEEAEKTSMSIMRMESGQQSVVGGRRTADSGEHAQISEIMSNKGSGHGLDDNTRSFMGERFGYDFRHVRLHNDSYAARKSNELNAEAFTIGRDVFFNAGRYNPSSTEGKRLLAHELTHVAQQENSNKYNKVNEYPKKQSFTSINFPQIQCDLARPPRGVPAPIRELTPEEIEEAIAFNRERFSDPYSIRVIRDVLGLEPLPAMIDEDFVRAVAEWQAERRMTQDGQIGHLTTRSLYLELVAEGEFRDAISLLMDSYRLPEDLRLHDVRVGTGLNYCHTATVPDADAVTSGGPHCGGGPIIIRFCRPRIPRTIAEYDHFVRIAGHELIHIPHCAVGPVDPNVREFEAYFWEECERGRSPQLSAAQRIAHAQTALNHFALIPGALRTPARIAMRNQLNNLIAAGGVGPC